VVKPLRLYYVILCNAILTGGHFPIKWGEGVIMPIHKQADVTDVDNYRGITMMSFCSNILLFYPEDVY
jgi:hypothetical protein